MLHLKTRIHLHEIKAVFAKRARAVDNEFHRACANIIHGLGGIDRGRTHGRTNGRGHARCRCFLDDFLVATLQRTITLIKVNHAPAAITENLHLDMARIGDEFLDQNTIITETLGRLTLATLQGGEEILRCINLAHALATTPGDSLDEHRVTDFVGRSLEPVRILTFFVITGCYRNICTFHQSLRLVFQTHRPNGICRRSDKDDVIGSTGFSKLGILGKEAVTRVDRLGASLFGHLDDLVRQQIAFRCRRRPDQHSFVCLAHMRRVGIGLGINSNTANAHALGGSHDTAGDLAPIGNKQRIDHGESRSDGRFEPLYCTAATRTKLMIIRRYHEPSLLRDTICQACSCPG